MSNNFNIGERVRELRIQHGLSQEQLALHAEITTTYLGLIERNQKNPTVRILEQICIALNISLADFFSCFQKSSETIDPLLAQISAQLNHLSDREKEIVLQLIKNVLKLRNLSDR